MFLALCASIALSNLQGGSLLVIFIMLSRHVWYNRAEHFVPDANH